LTLVISILALVATFYQLYLQRAHNEKSLKPLGMIEFLDRENHISIYLRNNGVGPLILDRLSFAIGKNQFSNIDQGITIDPKSYMRYTMEEGMHKVIPPEGFLELFESTFEFEDGQVQMDFVRQELSGLSIKAFCRDVYDNKILLERNCRWFARNLETQKPALNS
jgi:hypothetical protein